MPKSIVYFTKSTDNLAPLRLLEALGKKLEGKILAKVHSGEEGNQNFLPPDFWLPTIKELGATVGECNTAYKGARFTSKDHYELLKKHGWITTDFPFDLMDAEGPDAVLPIGVEGHLGVNYVGKNLLNYDSIIVLSHFKGHPMGGYGGALKQLSIGFASSYGKAHIHCAGDPDHSKIWTAPHDAFLESMAEAAYCVNNLFKGKAIYLNAMMNLSVDCDCCSVAEDPCMKDVGILISLDPVAIDRACIDLVKKSTDPGREHFLERVNSRNGEHTIDVAEKLGTGSQDYELVII